MVNRGAVNRETTVRNVGWFPRASSFSWRPLYNGVTAQHGAPDDMVPMPPESRH